MKGELRIGVAPEDFIWASGVEDTFVPQTRPGHRALDEYQLMGHYEHWREDLALLRDLRVQAVRWGVPWYRVEPTPGEFDWRWIDEVLSYLVEDLHVTPIIDLMHYGCPFWLRREFASEAYPDAVAAYAAAFAQRYAHLVRWYTPLNEPLVNALMCGRRGLWPPYLRGDSGYIRIMLQLAKGILNTVDAIKAVDSSAVMVHVEAAGLNRAVKSELEVLAVEDQRRGYLCYDLITGLVGPDHPLFPWLVRNGTSVDDLAALAGRPIHLDLLGLNFYPQWSTKQLYLDQRGRLAYRSVEQDGAGFADLIRDYQNRYQVPVMITETSAFGKHDVRSRWLEASVAAVKSLRAEGVPVIGYTWFPMFTMIDWKYRLGRQPVERYRIDLGLYTIRDGERRSGLTTAVQEEREGTLGRWVPTSLVDQFTSYVAQPAEAIGRLGVLDGAEAGRRAGS